MPADPNPANASISHRTYFYPLPHPLPPGTPIPYSAGLPSQNPLDLPATPVEPTSSLVLTSTTKQFIDVRVFKPILEEDPELPNEGGPRARLDWAFAGTSYSVPIPDPYPHGVTEHAATASRHAEHHRAWPAPITHATWTHWLDSRHPISSSPTGMPKDEGTMFPLSATQTLEFGEGINPATGKMWAYEELWTDEAPRAAPTREEADPLVYSIVLRCEDEAHDVRGVVMRLGRYCQGILMKGGYVSVERWEWVVEDGLDKEVGGWKRSVRIGDQFLPCAPTFTPAVLSVGGKVRYWDYEWVCEEKVAWREGPGATEAGVRERQE
ncbi:hypothetical protein DPSP01_011212 [Paraphaeosphaeria sporulosa]|uniref:Protein HRI1 n=1 Tax=Paraphaeosphaeria sporulosa TaxID=1460663 RepID=A0A177CLK2_9PLEO|nr:uncharacterized protein CC84DRAFT_1257262 [Paraphaeosphaeria sporulosa]OAG08393.1 hypothetical protein CC84DRAFT_1257262 [Paraphaeosphaeria sporulosa]